MAGRLVRAFPLNASGIIADQSLTVMPVHLHSMILTETGGTTNETLRLYVPTVATGQAPAVASASGTLVGTIIVPKGTTLAITDLGEEGWYFSNGLYVAASGGTLAGTFGIS